MTTQQITTAAGETFTIRLHGAATAGYRWEVGTLPPEIRLEPGGESPGDAGKPGDPQEQVFQFRALKVGQYSITLVYKRSWEKEAASTQTIWVTVR
jgi:predicted secreted protein